MNFWYGIKFIFNSAVLNDSMTNEDDKRKHHQFVHGTNENY